MLAYMAGVFGIVFGTIGELIVDVNVYVQKARGKVRIVVRACLLVDG